PPEGNKPFGDKSPIQAMQRDNVSNRPQRHQMKQGKQVGLWTTVVPEIALAQFACDRDKRDEHQPHRREMAKTGQVVSPVWIDDRNRIGEPLVCLVVIDYDSVETSFRASARGPRLVTPQSTV